MTTFIQDYYLFFMVVLLSLSILILLRSILGLVGQVIYFSVFVFICLSYIVLFVIVIFLFQSKDRGLVNHDDIYPRLLFIFHGCFIKFIYSHPFAINTRISRTSYLFCSCCLY